MDATDSPFSRRGLKFHHRNRFLFILPCFALFTVFLASLRYVQSTPLERSIKVASGRHLLQRNAQQPACIPPSIDSFPEDFFTQEERLRGGVVIHFIILLYFCGMLTVVCDSYFVPSLDIICERLKLPSDVAGATFMAIGTSSPELFSSIIGAFITEGDIGIGTIVGSAVFNIFGVTGVAGIVLWDTEVLLDWYPVSRDASVYAVTVAVLTAVISNNFVTWWEALIMLVMSGMYIILMTYNSVVETFSRKQAVKARKYWFKCFGDKSGEKTPLLKEQVYAPEVKEESRLSKDSYSVEIPASKPPTSDDGLCASTSEEKSISELDIGEDGSLCSVPTTGAWHTVWWLLMWPASLLFFFTIPDCRKKHLQRFFIVTFLSSTLWLGALSYLCVWMVTIIGFTFGIPDAVSGLTLLAVGTSLPEVVSSILVVKNGLGNMVMSNLIGSNIFDILFCLGAPWFIKTLMSEDGYLIINSSALTYTTTTLLATVVGLLLVFHLVGWKLNRTMGLVCLLLYFMYVALACLYELNVFGEFNPPPC